MKEHPILFSTDMVKANLDGRKTMTRRIIKPQPIIDLESGFVFDGKHKKQYDIHNWKDQFIDDWARWMPEDLIWVRETWKPRYIKGCLNEFRLQYPKVYPWFYSADGECESGYGGWKPSIHMPKDAAGSMLKL